MIHPTSSSRDIVMTQFFIQLNPFFSKLKHRPYYEIDLKKERKFLSFKKSIPSDINKCNHFQLHHTTAAISEQDLIYTSTDGIYCTNFANGKRRKVSDLKLPYSIDYHHPLKTLCLTDSENHF